MLRKYFKEEIEQQRVYNKQESIFEIQKAQVETGYFFIAIV